MKLTNLVYVLRDDQVLLGLKKIRLGKGKYNGFGGEIREGETPVEGAIREMKEESGLEVSDLQERGYIECMWETKPENDQRVYIFVTENYQGEPVETEECIPEWFEVSDLPWDKMWEDDRDWLLKCLGGEAVYWRFYFDENNKVIYQEDLQGSSQQLSQ